MPNITVTTVQTRPDSTARFWEFNNATSEYLQNTFRASGKVLNSSVTESSDGLTRTVVRTFLDQPAFVEWKADPVRREAITSRASYNTTNQHSQTDTIA
jgi:hypothetical protein